MVLFAKKSMLNCFIYKSTNYDIEARKLSITVGRTDIRKVLTIEEVTRIEQKRSYFFLHCSIWHL